MTQRSTIVGLDVHKDTIAVAIADRAGGDVRDLGVIPNDPESLARLIRRHGPAEQVAACYEAGPCGYGIYRQLTDAGVARELLAFIWEIAQAVSAQQASQPANPRYSSCQ